MMKKIIRGLQIAGILFREVFQILYGFYRISNLKQPCISIFGGSRLGQESYYALQARTLARLSVEHGISVLTGGGPGIMEAANCGALEVKNNYASTIGIGINGLRHKESVNSCAGKTVMLDYFFSRKWLLINYSMGFVIFPGGLGTMDELSELLNGMDTGKIASGPIVLIGSEFWNPYIEWMNCAQKEGLLSSKASQLFVITDDIEQAVKIIVAHCASCLL